MVSPYSDGSAYDCLVDDHLTPSIYDDRESEDAIGRTARSARALHFKDVVAGLDMTGAAAREPWDAAGNRHRPSIPGVSPPEPSAPGAGAGADNLQTRAADTPRGS